VFDEDLHVLELGEQHVALSRADVEMLLRVHAEHLDLRQVDQARVPGSGLTAWVLRAGHFCGVIPLPSGRRLCIEPRTPVNSIWYLLVAGEGLAGLSWPGAATASVSDLVEGLATVFLHETEKLLQGGPCHAYHRVRRTLPTIRGRLDIREQLRNPDRLPFHFTCSFDEFTVDIPENRLLVAALEAVSRIGLSRDLRERARRAVAAFDGVRSAEPCPCGEIRLTSANQHYGVALGLARLVLAETTPAARRGAGRAPGLLVHMPRLFERFVCRMVAEGLPPWLHTRSRGHSVALDEERRAMLTPDAIIEQGGLPLCIVDAKYRAFSESGAEPGASDLYQMLAYCLGYRVSEAILVYPYRVQTPPVRIRRGDCCLQVHPLGMDLSGDAESLRAEHRRLCARIAEIVSQAGCMSGAGTVAPVAMTSR
jgi:5-methylcytosine-specific restriction enzyme subunit McrC